MVTSSLIGMRHIPVHITFTIMAILMLIPGNVWGYGVGLDTTNAMDVAGKKIQITAEIVDHAEFGSRIIVTASEKNSDENIGDVTLFVKLQHDGKVLFSERFIAPDGILRFAAYAGSEPVKIDGVWEEDLEAWRADGDKEVVITGAGLDSEGLYMFDVGIENVAWSDELPDDRKMFHNDVSIVEETYHMAYGSDNSAVKFYTRSYFDKISDFEYDSDGKHVTFRMPFNWDDRTISQIFVVHIETIFPKNFTEFYSPSYVGTANGIELFDSSVTIDDYTDENFRIVHFILLGDHLRYLKNTMEKTGEIPKEIVFGINRSDEIRFPLTAMTRDEQFQVDLSWTPLEIPHGEKIRFIFTIRDGSTGEPLRHSSYDFLIVQSNDVLYKTSGKAVVGGYYEEYTFEEGQTGPTTIRFENIRGTGERTEFSVVVVPELPVPILALAVAVTIAAVLGRSRIVRI